MATKGTSGVKGTAKLTSKGQCTIPKSVRDELGLKPGGELDFYKDKDGRIVLKRHIEGDPFAKWRGYAKHLAGVDTVAYVREARGE